ncbi:MAG: FkbM family methyltransferase [Paracoccaceae bacterium]|jgi:FkbM family methyltransferase
MSDPEGKSPESLLLEERFAKMKRREARNLRTAGAHGLMQGVCSMLKPGDVVLDCGANVGEVTTVLAATGATVHSFEPDPYAFARLSDATKEFENVTLHNAAVGVTAGSIQLMRAVNFDDNPQTASVKSTVISGGRMINEDASNAIDVAQLSLLDFIDDIVDDHGEVTFLKMDIEGAELDILEQMLARKTFEKIRLTVAETHENKFKELRPRFRALRAAVSEDYPLTKVNLDWI